jgi:hypothetical protein
LDCETDGIHPNRKPWEIAMIRRSGEFQIEQEFFVDIDLGTADPVGLRIGGFYERHPWGRQLSGADDYSFGPVASWADEGFKSRLDAAHLVARMTHGAHLIGAVPNFDTEVLDRLLRDNGILPAWHYHLQDVETLAVGYLRGQGKPVPALPWKSDELMAAIGVEVPSDAERHTAMGDARWAMRTYDKIMGS